jgi:hypothetical protein
VAAACGAAYWTITGAKPVGSLTLVLGVLGGFFFVSTAWIMTAAMARVGIGITVAVTRLSVILPILASITVYAEYPSLVQVLGLALAGVALYLFGVSAGALQEGARQPLKNWLILAGVFAAMGCANLLLKLFSEHCSRADKPGFLTVVFVVARCSPAPWPSSEGTVAAADIRLTAAGRPNYRSTIFFILALAAIPGIIVPGQRHRRGRGLTLVGRRRSARRWPDPARRCPGTGPRSIALINTLTPRCQRLLVPSRFRTAAGDLVESTLRITASTEIFRKVTHRNDSHCQL